MSIIKLLFWVAIVIAIVLWLNKQKGKKLLPTRTSAQPPVVDTPQRSYPSNQRNLQLIAQNAFEKRYLLNGGETKLYWALINHIKEKHPKLSLSVFSQVAIGEFIRCCNQKTYPIIAAKRVDFLIAQQEKRVDKENNSYQVYCPLVVVELQGRGHYQGDTVYERDAEKRAVCEKAGIPFLEFKENYDEVEFNLLSKELIGAINQ